MQRTYVIDGYNVVHASPELRRTMKEVGPERAAGDLLNAVAGFAERHDCRCIVVFDGVARQAESGGRITHRVQAVSSRDRSADDLIRELSRRDGPRLVVVSSDMEIVGTARATMSEVLPSKAFAAKLTLGTHSDGLGPPADGSARPHRIAELRERSEKPGGMSRDDVEEWKRLFGE